MMMSARLKFSRSLGTSLMLLVSFVCAGCHTKPADDAGKPIVPVQAVHPEVASITEDIIGDAVLAPVAQAAMQSKVAAPIDAFYVQRGSKVKAGEILAKLENHDLAAAALDNEGGYIAAQGAYTMTTQQQVPQEETQARLDLEQAKATLDLDESILKARSQLFDQGAVPGREVDSARTTRLQAQAAYLIAKQKFDSIAKVGRQASLETARGQLASAKGKYLEARAQLSYTSIRSPISGIVTERPLFAGETAAAGAAILTVMDTSVLIAKLHLAQRQAQQIAVGAAATIVVPGVDDPVAAKVSLISPALDPGSTTVEVWLHVDNASGALKPGTMVHATIKGKLIRNALIIPLDAVQRSSDTGGKIVMVIGADGTVHQKNIMLGIQTRKDAQVLDGLSEGDMVMTTGGYGLEEGTKVKIAVSSQTPANAFLPAAGAKE